MFRSELLIWYMILCLDRNRPLRPRTCKEEEQENMIFSGRTSYAF
jgi:hypothetical protein